MDGNRGRTGHPFFRGGGYYPPAALDTRPCVGAHSVRPRFCGCLRPPPTRKRWGRGPRRGTSQGGEGKGMPGPAGRAAARAARRERYTEPGGRPRGPPLRGRREGNPGHGGPVWDRPLRGRGTKRAGRIRSAHGIGFPLFVGGYEPLPTPDTRFSWGRISSARCVGHPFFRRGGYYPPAAPGTRSCVGAHSVRPRFCGCLRPPPTRKRWGRGPRRGTSQGGEGKGMPGPAGRAAARAARRERYTEPGGRPRGPPLRGRREGNPGPVGLKERGCRARRAGLGPAPTGKRNKARRADTFRPRYRISVFRGGGYAPLPHRVPAFRGADMNRSPHQIPAFRRGGYHPPAAPGTRSCVGAHSVRPRFRGCSRPPPTRKRRGRGPGRGTSQGAAGCRGGPKGKVY